MHKFLLSLKAGWWPAGVLVVAYCLLSSAVLAAPDAERKEELRYLLEQDCGSCHGLTRKGGLGSPLLPENVAETPDEILLEVILEGIPGTPMPPWRGQLTEREAHWLVDVLLEGEGL